MASLGKSIDPTAHDTTQNDYELLPTGIYQLEVSASDVKKEDGNTTLALTYDVVAPEQYKSRKIFAYIDIEHKETDKQERGQRDFAKLCRAMSISDSVDDSEALHFITFTAKVQNSPAGVSKAGNPYKAKNRVQKFFFPDEGNVPEPAIDENQPAPAAAAAKPANDNRKAEPAKAAASAGAAKKRPW